MLKLATMYGIGEMKFAPGTLGSLAATLLAWGIVQLPFGVAMIWLGIVLLGHFGIKAANAYMKHHHVGGHDPSSIVVDEWAGQWLTFGVWYLWLFMMAGNVEAAVLLLQEVSREPVYLGIGFVLFRFFDIVKPWPISLADRKVKGGFGVMLDDLIAAFAAGTLLYVFYFLAPLVTGELMESPV